MSAITTAETLAEGVAPYLSASRPVNFYHLVPYLLELYPDWSREDVEDFIEEKTGRRVHPEDQITLAAVFQRCVLRRQEFELVGNSRQST
jgi:hypothetical protein